MSVSGELLCSFELLKPLDSSALKSHIKKSRNKRQSMLNSPVRIATELTEFLHYSGLSIAYMAVLTSACSPRNTHLKVTNLILPCRVTIVMRHLDLPSSRELQRHHKSKISLIWRTN
jgi:serine/threonine-protein phosphatase PP1 catalytic subunit